MKIILLPSITILVWVLHHNIKKNKNPGKQGLSDYLAKEDTANGTRKQDISNLPYIAIPMDSFPLDITLKDEKKQCKISEYVKEIRNLSDKKMLNLIGVTNTELKETYGPANLEILSVYDQNYSRYIRTLHLFAECLYEEYPNEAVSIWEYCISIGTDISGTYDLLGKYYCSQQDKEHFLKLYDAIPSKDSISGKIILSKLDALKALF